MSIGYKTIKLFKGVRIYSLKSENNETWYCDFEDYKYARKKKNMSWSEKSFCDWCDKNNLFPVG